MSSQHASDRQPNHLIHENSPYLLQHAYNPVEWYPWGEEALEKAAKEDKMLLISIGYAACHWCHVMEHESFEDTAVAQVMNEHFVCIKVDREERPDIDDVYMTACQLASGRSCGWPLNAFAMPDGRPVWAGTYFPKDRWVGVLDQFRNMWVDEKEKLESYAQQLTSGIQQQDRIIAGEPQPLDRRDAEKMADSLLKTIDMKKGGRKGAPKFPMPNNYLYLLNYHVMTGDSEALEAVTTTLDGMAHGGIYDQLGGGFARYSVDENWLAPHFEKMLYDNGQMLTLYARAFQVNKSALYEKVIRETVSWLDRELTHEQGGFYSSLDADSEGEEGKFYVWDFSEIVEILGDEKATIFNEYYTVKKNGNWEHKNILHRTRDNESIAKSLGISANELQSHIAEASEILIKHRNKRVRPGLDDKILTSWNALAISGLVHAYQALDDISFLDRALRTATFISTQMLQDDYRLMRNYKDGQVKINAFLDDYAFLISAFVDLYQVTFEEKWLKEAKKLADYTLQHFHDSESGFFNYTSDLDPPLIARKRELGDNVIPGSNSAMARNLHRLGLYFDNDLYKKIAEEMLYAMINPILESGQTGFYSNWAIAYLEKMHSTYEVAILGPESKDFTLKMQQRFLPNTLYLGGEDEGSLALLKDKLQPGATTIYVCQNKVCQLPVSEVDKAVEQISFALD